MGLATVCRALEHWRMYLSFLPVQCFSACGDFYPNRHSTMSRDILWCHNQEMLLVSMMFMLLSQNITNWAYKLQTLISHSFGTWEDRDHSTHRFYVWYEPTLTWSFFHCYNLTWQEGGGIFVGSFIRAWSHSGELHLHNLNTPQRP